jgi:nicotinic acid phosphoribosyltransferase
MNKNLLDDILKSMQDNNYKIVELETTTAINERKNQVINSVKKSFDVENNKKEESESTEEEVQAKKEKELDNERRGK